MKLLKQVLFPTSKQCVLCNRKYIDNMLSLKKLPMICHICDDRIPYIRLPICTCCGREMEADASPLCSDCLKRSITYFVCNRSAVRFNDVMREWIHTYKFHGREHLVIGLVELLYTTYNQYYQSQNIDAITFIPLHEDRLFERRFNQAEQLAVGLSKKTALPVISTLTRIRYTEKQSHQSRNERLHSIAGAFQYIESTSTKNSILLVDDIYTTGSTLNEAAKTLQQNGWEKIYTCTIARA